MADNQELPDDGDLFQFTWNFMSQEEGNAVVKACEDADPQPTAEETQKVVDFFDELTFHEKYVFPLVFDGLVLIRWSAETNEPVFQPRKGVLLPPKNGHVGKGRWGK